MKLQSIVDVPPIGDSEAYDVLFSDETGPVTKRIRYGSCEGACGLPKDWGRKLLTAMREAERDIAYRMFGKDEWHKQVGPMWGPPMQHELRMGGQALVMRPDLFDREMDEARA
jgi:hypothetical protein